MTQNNGNTTSSSGGSASSLPRPQTEERLMVSSFNQLINSSKFEE